MPPSGLHDNNVHKFQWSDDELPVSLVDNDFPDCETQRDLKESLYYRMIDYYDKGKVSLHELNTKSNI